MGGTLTLTRTCRSDPVQPACGFGTVFWWERVLCTLLGPEGPGRRRLRTVPVGPLDFVRRHGFGRVGEEYRPYFENYTVDASILKMQTKWDGRLRVSGSDRLCHKLSRLSSGMFWVTHVISIF